MRVFFWEKLALPALARFTRYDVWDHVQAYDAEYARRAGEREPAREERLAQLLQHAYANVPLYRDKFDSVGLKPRDIRSFDDLRKLPLTTKAELKEAFPERAVATNYREQTLRKSQSGATSGTPMHVRMDVPAVVRKYAEITRHERMNGWHVGDATVHSLPCPYVDYYVRGLIEDGTFVEGLKHLLRRRRGLKDDLVWYLENYVAFPLLHDRLLLRPVIHLDGSIDDAMTADHLRRMQRHEPVMVRSHPLYAYLWARHVQRTGEAPPPMGAMELTGGLVSEWMKDFTEQQLQSRAYDYYGSAEIGGIAAECHERTGMHVYENILHMEFLVGDRPAEPEETSSIVITDLLNFAMPFIRYQTDDIGRFHARSHCPCGLDTVRMEVEGRTFEMLRDVDSRELTSQQVMDLVWGWGDVYLWQLRLTEPGRGTFAYFPDRQPEAEVDAVLDGLHGLLGPDWRIERLPSSHLKPEERGKYCFVKALYPRELPQLFPDRLV